MLCRCFGTFLFAIHIHLRWRCIRMGMMFALSFWKHYGDGNGASIIKEDENTP